jgi:hypothetical protein
MRYPWEWADCSRVLSRWRDQRDFVLFPNRTCPAHNGTYRRALFRHETSPAITGTTNPLVPSLLKK